MTDEFLHGRHNNNRFRGVTTNLNRQEGGIDSNGIAAQRRDIDLFPQQQHQRVTQEFVDVEYGAAGERPVLYAAIQCCLKHRHPLLTKKVGRQTQDVETLRRLAKMKNLEIKIASLSNADNFIVHLYRILTSQARELILQFARTGIIETAQNCGVKIGNQKLAEINKIRTH